MGILVNRLLVMLNEQNPDTTYYYIALTILEHIAKIGGMNINEIAELCSTSKSTISKFIRTLGYEDFSDFKHATEMEKNRYRRSTSYVSDVSGYLEEHTYEEYAKALAVDLLANSRSMDMEGIQHLADDIYNYKHVGVFGLMFSETAALDLQIKLGRLGKFIMTNMDDLKQYQYIKNADQDTLIIIFSESGTFMDRYEMSDPVTGESIFSSTKAKLVMITANEKKRKDQRLSYIVRFQYMDKVHTHRILYQFFTDVLANEYIHLLREHGIFEFI